MTEYEMRISDWSSDVCSSDLLRRLIVQVGDVPDVDLLLARLHLLRVVVRHGGIGLHAEPPLADEARRREPAEIFAARPVAEHRYRPVPDHLDADEIGRASCRGSGCQSV